MKSYQIPPKLQTQSQAADYKKDPIFEDSREEKIVAGKVLGVDYYSGWDEWDIYYPQINQGEDLHSYFAPQTTNEVEYFQTELSTRRTVLGGDFDSGPIFKKRKELLQLILR